MFPVSDKSTSVINLLESEVKKLGIKVFTRTKITKIEKSNNTNCETFYIQKEPQPKQQQSILKPAPNQFSLIADKIILATGSSKIGYSIVQELGHGNIAPLPSLFSMKLPSIEKSFTDLAGISVPFVKVQLKVPEVIKLRHYASSLSDTVFRSFLVQRGPLLITKQGFSGPAILKLSAYSAKLLAAMNYKCEMVIHWFGELSIEELKQWLKENKALYSNRKISGFSPYTKDDLLKRITNHEAYRTKHSLHEFKDSNKQSSDDSNNEDTRSLLPRRLWEYLLIRAGISTELLWKQLDEKSMDTLLATLYGSCFTIEGRGLYRDEFVTCGGVSLKEVTMDTMESKICKGIYFAGEILDIDGITGGYNFQSAWTTGYIAGDSCARSLAVEC
jgi:predicted flavoprotein YhiN